MKVDKHLNNRLINKNGWRRRAVILFLGLVPNVVVAQNTGTASSTSAAQELGATLNRLINFGLGLLVLLSVALIIYTAFMFATAGGDSEKFRTARRWLVYIIVAVVVGLLSKVFVAVIFEIAGKSSPF